MNLKYFLKLITCLIPVLIFASCNSSDNEYEVGEGSSDGQIISFAIDARPYTAIDTLTYPALKKTLFSVNNKNEHSVFNLDSLPQYTNLAKGVHVTLEFSTLYKPKVELVYKDSVADWNHTDSIHFKYQEDILYPKLQVSAANTPSTQRLYTVDFRIHKIDPDSIKWERALLQNTTSFFDLKKKGDTRVFKNGDNFLAFTKEGTNVYTYTSPIENPTWNDPQAISLLPSDLIMASIQQTSEMLVALASDGSAYVSDGKEGLIWEKKSLTNLKAIMGLLPEIDEGNPKYEFLVVYNNDQDELVFGKTADFNAIEDIKISTRGNSMVGKEPIREFSSTQHNVGQGTYIILTGGFGKDELEKPIPVDRSWKIANVALANANNKAEISILPGITAHALPSEDNVTSFLYDKKVYALSSDSLSLYHSNGGDTWIKASKKQKLDKAMTEMHMPSVIADEQNYIWVFGGTTKNGSYSQQIWRGRINRLIPKE